MYMQMYIVNTYPSLNKRFVKIFYILEYVETIFPFSHISFIDLTSQYISS
jgi:hypothetical protein